MSVQEQNEAYERFVQKLFGSETDPDILNFYLDHPDSARHDAVELAETQVAQ